MSPVSRFRSGPAGNDGIATTVECALLVGISVAIFLAIGTATYVFSSTAENDAIAIAAFNVAMKTSSMTCEVAGSGNISAESRIDLPERICSMPYLVYPSPDDHNICVSVSGHMYRAPVSLRASGIRITGFMASTPAEHTVTFDALTGTVTLS